VTTDPSTINRIVSEVLKRIRASEQLMRNGVGSVKQDTKRVVISERVITEELLQKQHGQQHLQFRQNAIITPAARDYLNERKICWSRDCDQSATAANAKTNRLLIVVNMTPVVRSVLDDIKKNSRDSAWKQELVSCVGEANRLAVSALCRADMQQVIVICREVYELVCQANRNDKVRAAAVSNVAAIEAAQAQIQPNLLAVNPNGQSFIELRNLVRNTSRN